MLNIIKEVLLMVFFRRQYVEDFYYVCEFNCDDFEYDYFFWIDISVMYNDYFVIFYNFCENYFDNVVISWRCRILGIMWRF